ncbi:hypothetical protein HDU87_005708 [Geranomyces variabilis]|uniref:Uracil-DNA glycosylase-like domain-containing protein n=1 Tax=Geranomyces variabilis TaxID=109894 RepID=A0AAD5TGF5_9FUNG|nr:hypothetical protein HDU87_005708 [Geranomyces variabilis]
MSRTPSPTPAAPDTAPLTAAAPAHVAFRSLVSRFAFVEPQSPRVAKRNRTPSPPRARKDPSKPVADLLAPDLRILFIGFNPGTRSAATGHHYAHGGNFFWKCLSESGLAGGEVLSYEDDERCVKEFSFGFTNIVSRSTPSSVDLSAAEYAAGCLPLCKILDECTPRVACFVGIAVWEAFRAYMLKQEGKKVVKGKVEVGLQPFAYGDTKLFVVPSTSGRVVGWTKDARVKLFADLKKVLDDLEAADATD